ncbi:MAG TPA: hypothetical protein PLX03_07485 [Candidatus Hydrogenedentes bacterium]|nr:hypothetical protein [Candidatus Hydrogenedentota bacterium]
MKRHLKTVTRPVEPAQISNFQIKMEAISAIIDRLLLVPRQSPWKATGPSGTTTDTVDTDTGTGTTTGETTTGTATGTGLI